MKKTVQYFSDEYLESCKQLTPDQILEFIESYRMLQFEPGPSKLISIKVPENLLKIFRNKCNLEKVPYQTKIKGLMNEWAV